jgi:hypothetical protein
MTLTGTFRILANIALLLVLAYLALFAALFVFQSQLVFLPGIGRDVTTTPRVLGLGYEDVWLDVEPGVRVHGWYVPRVQAKGAVLILHGNAGSIALRIDWLRMFHELGYASLIIDYRGYGKSSGSPSEQGVYADAQAAWNHLTGGERGFKAKDIVVFGKSLGGPIAALLAAKTAPRALILHSTFTSVPDVAQEIYRIFPVRWASRISFDTRAYLGSVRAPVFIAHSPDDEIIAYHHSQRLYEAAGEPKRLLTLQGGHNSAFIFMRREWIEALARFLADSQKAHSQAEQAGNVVADRHR